MFFSFKRVSFPAECCANKLRFYFVLPKVFIVGIQIDMILVALFFELGISRSVLKFMLMIGQKGKDFLHVLNYAKLSSPPFLSWYLLDVKNLGSNPCFKPYPPHDVYNLDGGLIPTKLESKTCFN